MDKKRDGIHTIRDLTYGKQVYTYKKKKTDIHVVLNYSIKIQCNTTEVVPARL